MFPYLVSGSKNMKSIIVLIILAVLGGGYYWYSSMSAPTVGTEDDSITNTSGMPIIPNSPSDTVVDETIVVKEFNFTNEGMKFDTTSFSVKKGDRVKVTYTNGGGTHDLRIDGYSVGTKVLQKDASESFEFVADKAGSFEFYCSVGNHRAMGMKGTFTVTE